MSLKTKHYDDGKYNNSNNNNDKLRYTWKTEKFSNNT